MLMQADRTIRPLQVLPQTLASQGRLPAARSPAASGPGNALGLC